MGGAGDPRDPVTVWEAQGEAEAQTIRAFLEGQGIPAAFRGESARTVYGFTMNGLGKVEIQVPAELADEARDLLRRMEAGEFTLADDEDPDLG